MRGEQTILILKKMVFNEKPHILSKIIMTIKNQDYIINSKQNIRNVILSIYEITWSAITTKRGMTQRPKWKTHLSLKILSLYQL